MSVFELYLLTLLGPIHVLFSITAILCLLAAGFATFFGTLEDSWNEVKRFVKISTIVGTIAVCLAVFVPDKERLAIIVGGHILTNSEGVSKIPDNTSKAINKLLEDYIEKDSE